MLFLSYLVKLISSCFIFFHGYYKLIRNAYNDYLKKKKKNTIKLHFWDSWVLTGNIIWEALNMYGIYTYALSN